MILFLFFSRQTSVSDIVTYLLSLEWDLVFFSFRAASAIFIHKLLIDNPALAAALGTSEWLVIPGIELTSSA
jgi:hypothetical protein